jgi:3-phosphoshikimate 1-carboxyvinyltransferase
MRLLSGLCAGFPWRVHLDGDESLRQRPMDRVAAPLNAMGARVNGRGPTCRPPLRVEGGSLAAIDYALPVPSAQVKGAVLLAGLRAAGETVVREQVPTRRHTEEMLAACGADISVDDDGVVRVRASACHARAWDVPGDPSQAAFWIVAACMVPNSDIVVEDVYLGPGRAAFLDVLTRMGADLTVSVGESSVGDVRARASALEATTVGGVEVAGLIDEIPALAVAATAARGTTRFSDAAELRVKESDRIATLTSELTALGADIEEEQDGFAIAGPTHLHGANVSSHGDHRIAMAMAVAGLTAAGETSVVGWEAVDTSYPEFEDDLRSCAS